MVTHDGVAVLWHILKKVVYSLEIGGKRGGSFEKLGGGDAEYLADFFNGVFVEAAGTVH